MKTWTTKDKSEWPKGEWDDEPDKAQWIDEKTGLDCLIVRNGSGALCGYVGVPAANKNFEVEYDDVRSNGEWLEVHGGLTFSDKCKPSDDESTGICHAGDIANDIVWWLGFDCAHSGDILPKLDFSFSPLDSYCNFDYVKREVTNLASMVI